MTREMLSKVKNNKEALETQKALFQSGNLETAGKTNEELQLELQKISKEIDNLDVEINSIEQSLGLKRDKGVLDVEQELLKEAGELEKEIDKSDKNKEMIEFPRKIEELNTVLKELFESVDLKKLVEKDEKGEKKNWGDTYVESFEKFKKKVLDTAPYRFIKEWEKPSELEAFELLYDQKPYQEIVRFVAGNSPKVFLNRDGNIEFNTMIQERPEFLESKEIREVYKYLLIKGIQDNTLFQGYHQSTPTERVFSETKKDFIEENKENWGNLRSKLKVGKENEFDDFGRPIVSGGVRAAIKQQNESEKTKRIRVPDSDKGFIVNLKEYQYNPDLLDNLDKMEIGQVRKEFLKEIDKNIYSKYHSKEIFADEIFRVGEKLKVKKSEIESHVLQAMMQGIINGNPPTNGIDKEFSNVYESIQGILQDPEKRANLSNQIIEKVKEKDLQFSEWNDTQNYTQLTEDEKNQLTNSYLDMSQSESVQSKSKAIFGDRWAKDEELYFNKEQQLSAFNSMSPKQRAVILQEHFTDWSPDFKDFSRIEHLPFEKDDIVAFTNEVFRNIHNINSDYIQKIQLGIGEHFPTIKMDENEIIASAVFTNAQTLADIVSFYENRNIPLTQEAFKFIKDPEEFVRKQINGAEIYKLEALENFREKYSIQLPYLSDELFGEIKKHILLRKHDAKYMLSIQKFIPKDFKMAILTDPELQQIISNQYGAALIYSGDSGFNLSFLVSQKESKQKAEEKSFNDIIADKNLYRIKSFLENLQLVNPGSEYISETKKFINEHFDEWLSDSKNFYVLEDISSMPEVKERLKTAVDIECSKFTPENIPEEKRLDDLFRVKYKRNHYRNLNAFLKMKDVKTFEFFDKMATKYQLYNGGEWESFYNNISKLSDDNAEFGIKVLETGYDGRVRTLEALKNNIDDQVITNEVNSIFENLNPMTPLGELRGCIVELLQSSPEKIQDIGKVFEVSKISIGNIVNMSPDSLQQALVLVDFLGEKIPDKNRSREFLFERLRESPQEDWEKVLDSIEGEKMKREKNINLALNLEYYNFIPTFLLEKIESFKENYGQKGEKLIALAVAAYGYEEGNESIFLNKLEKIEKILNLYHPENIPEDCKVSMGIEYEVGRSIERNYSAGSYNGYVEDMTNISKAADIKRGNDAVWEIATKPTTNPYLLITEIKLLQDANMLDFNFEKYTNAARGFHLSLGGESGLSRESEDMYFLQNILTFSGYTGLLLGKEVSAVKGIHGKNLDSAGITTAGERVEFKGMGGDSFEQFEKTIITAHNVAIATQLEKKYQSGIELNTLQEKLILTEYKKLKDETVLAIKQHNESFLETEFSGTYFDKDGNYHEINLLSPGGTYAQKRESYLGDQNVDLGQEQKKYIITQNMFSPTEADSVNTITRANNLITFKKPILTEEYFNAQGIIKDEYRGNSSFLLNSMKDENNNDLSGKAQDSIFERDGKIREGYYALQGTSTEMITHKLQILINNFNKAMDELINNPDPEILASKKVSQYEYF